MNIYFKIVVLIYLIIIIVILESYNTIFENFDNENDKRENDLFLWSKRASNLTSYNLLQTETISGKDVIKRK